MATQSNKVRVRISLQGGGVLEGVNQIVRVVVEPEEIRCERVDDGHVLISGSVHAFLYFTRGGHKEVEGEGVKVPFSRRVDAPGLASGPVELQVEDAQSNYDYNPTTGAFQHRITLLINLLAKSQGLGSHQGETRLSQIRVGPAPEDEDVLVSQDEKGRLSLDPVEPATGNEPAAARSPEVAKDHTNDKDRSDQKETLVWKPFPPPIQ